MLVCQIWYIVEAYNCNGLVIASFMAYQTFDLYEDRHNKYTKALCDSFSRNVKKRI